MSRRANPYELYIAICRPAPNAAPPGSVLEIAVEAWVIFIACRNPSPGLADISMSQYVAWFHTASEASVSSSSHVIARTAAQTSP